MRDFLKECKRPGTPLKNPTLIFHNGSNYDVHLIWRQLIEDKFFPKDLIIKGQRILNIQFGKSNSMKCRDSLQFMPGLPLSAFPQAFGLESGPKGDFPHGINTPQWIRFDGKRRIYKELVDGEEHRFPLLKHFWPEKKDKEARAELVAWHAEQVAIFAANPTLEYCPEEKLVAYCRQDVRILREGFGKFRETCLDQMSEIDVLSSLTFPSYNNKIFRFKYMPENSIAILPPTGYDSTNRKYSLGAMAWIAWMTRKLGLKDVRTARHGGEVKVAWHWVDGAGVDAKGRRHILNFHGCYWHGHNCRLNQKAIKKNPELFEIRRETTSQNDADLLRKSNQTTYGPFTYHTIWECNYNKHLRTDPVQGQFYQDFIKRWSKEPLNLRSALRGGRTNVIKHWVELEEGEQLLYVDFTSLYPAINYGINGETWPIGHPQVYIGEQIYTATKEGLKDWFGFAKVDIFPPVRLLHPVLPVAHEDRVFYPLCNTCMKERRQGSCPHQVGERILHGTWFTRELDLAVEMGYHITKVYELWNWPAEQRSTTLFSGMIKDLYKAKACASKVPKDPAELQQLINEYKSTMNLSIDPNEFVESKTLRYLAKFSLVNIWGFLGKRMKVETVEVIKSYGHFLAKLDDKNIEVTETRVSPNGEDLIVKHRPIKEPASRTGNVALAAMTTAYARIALYSVIRKYPDQVCYFDTDSLILHLPPGMEPPPTSTVLGGLKDEVVQTFGPGSRMIAFYSTGPKSYLYLVEDADGQIHPKWAMKGISCRSEVDKVVTAEAFKKTVADAGKTTLKIPQSTIRRDFATARLWSYDFHKILRFYSLKRWQIPNDRHMSTLPYGYRQ